MARRASVFARETIPSLVDRYPGTGVSVPADPLPGVSLSRVDSTIGTTFTDRFGSYARGKVDNFAQCEARMSQLHEENAWLHERITNVANRIDDFARSWYGNGNGWNGRYGYNGYNGYNNGYPGYLDGRDSSSYMEIVRERERRNIGHEKDRMEVSLSAQRYHGRAERSGVFEDRDRDWPVGDVPAGGMYRGKFEPGDDGPREGSKLVENKFTRIKPEEKPPAEAKPKRSRKISSFKL